MIKIKTVDGRVLENLPDKGWNLNTVVEIEECLQETGKYWISHQNGSDTLRKSEVAEIFEV